MATFNTKLNFSDEFDKIASVFTKALDSSKKLSEKMTQEIESKNQQINVINSEISTIKAIEEKNNEFMNKLSEIVK